MKRGFAVKVSHMTTTRARSESGQVFALAAIAMVALCAMAGFSVDVASWYVAHRKQQAIADAAALAAVRSLPVSSTPATADAQTYATKNGATLPASNITYTTKYMNADTVTVQATDTAPSYFLKVLGINSAPVKATSTATAETLQAPRGAMPFGIFN